MLIEFSVSNYRSFRDEVTLSMVASPLKTGDGELDTRNQFAAPGDINLLTCAAIYGANASGKSNLISALEFVQRFVRNSHESTKQTGGIPVEPFRLSTRTESAPSTFELVFVLGEQHYRYGFQVTKDVVVSEWLHLVPEREKGNDPKEDGDEVVLFERDQDSISLHEAFEEEGGILPERTRPNALFLTVVTQFNGETAQRISDWFGSIEIASHWASLKLLMRLSTEQMISDSAYLKAVEAIVSRLDLGIESMQVEDWIPSPIDLPDSTPEELGAMLGAAQKLVEQSGKKHVRTVHRKFGNEGQPVESEVFDLDLHESQGTEKLFSLAGPLVKALGLGRVIVIDELDASMHPLLTREIVSLFTVASDDSNGAQLIFATQDTNLLDPRLLRRDQIWFAEKDRQGASHLYSLVDFKIENDAHFERDYIQGRYGAIPYLGNVRQIFLEQD